MKPITLILSCVALVCLPLSGFATETNTPRSVTLTGQDGVLKVWSRKDNRYIDEVQFIDASARAPFLILGEVHDNPLHHRLRGEIVEKIMASRAKFKPMLPPPAAVFEHATTDRQLRLDAVTARYATSSGGEDVDLFFKAANWVARGWPDSKQFAPLIRAVLNAKMPLYAGDVPRKRIMTVARGSKSPQSQELSKSEIAHLKLDRSLGAANNNAALAEIAEAHCGVLPDTMLEPMAYAQRLRDATLADVFIKAVSKHGSAILFTGNGHVREDRAVPWYVQERTGRPVMSVMFKEHQPADERTNGSRAEFHGGSGPPKSPAAEQGTQLSADYVIWTAARTRPDRCRKLREKYGKTKR